MDSRELFHSHLFPLSMFHFYSSHHGQNLSFFPSLRVRIRKFYLNNQYDHLVGLRRIEQGLGLERAGRDNYLLFNILEGGMRTKLKC